MKKNILVIIGSASSDSTNLKLIKALEKIKQSELNFIIYDELKSLPHFDPEISAKNPPTKIVDFRKLVQNSDGIIICTPEYVFSVPSGLKNAIEWCIITTVFMNKPC